MEIAKVNGVELEYEVVGTGEPVLLISPVLADGFLPLIAERASRSLPADRVPQARLGRQHPYRRASERRGSRQRRGRTPRPSRRARAHVAGHSSGGAVAAQLALDDPEIVETVMLLEPSLVPAPSTEAFLEQAGPAFEAYASGDHETALAIFMSVVGGVDWTSCRAVLDEALPGAVAQAVKDADTFFGVELPALTEWVFGREEAAAIRQPVLSVLGTDTQPVWVETAELLRSALPQVEECTIDGAGHLLHIQRPEPVARAMTEFLGRHPISSA